MFLHVFLTVLQVTTGMAALGEVCSAAPLRFAKLSASTRAPSKGSVVAAGLWSLCQNSQDEFGIGLGTGKNPLPFRVLIDALDLPKWSQSFKLHLN